MIAGPGPLGGLRPCEFLREYWQKQPLLVRGAFPGFRSPLDGDELAGLACDVDVESRLVVTEDGPAWSLRHGPFSDATFAALPARAWTLLLQDVDKHLPELAAIFDHFDFIPSWRTDDLMISWAADGGSVGPHQDRYDVFLIQAMGRRRWQVGIPTDDPRMSANQELRILAEFEPTEEWLLEPGDVLYLPPGVPHHGIAVGACMTWSIGFRAPSLADLVTDFADRLAQQAGEDRLYADPDLDTGEADGGRLAPRAVERIRRMLDDAWADAQPDLARWFGESVTSPKAWLHCVPPPLLTGAVALSERLRAGHGLVRDPRARMLWFDHGPDTVCLCVDGRSLTLPDTLVPLLELLCGTRIFPSAVLARYLELPGASRLLADLYNGGQLLEAAEKDD